MPNKTNSNKQQRHLKGQSRPSQRTKKPKDAAPLKKNEPAASKASPKKPKLSLCMIVMDEEETLPRCLESVKSLVNEIIIVDTGSTDKTAEIAEGYGATVLHKAWTGNFSEARNYAIQHAAGKWILQLDADEELASASASELTEIVNNREDIDVAYCIIQGTETGPAYTSQFYNPRLFRNKPGLYYEGMVHETPVISGNTLFSRIHITHHVHHTGDHSSAEKLESYKATLLKQLENNPDDLRTHYYLAKTYYDQRQFDSSISEAKEVLWLITNGAPLSEAAMKTFTLLACALWRKGNIIDAEKVCQKALIVKPNFADAPYLLGALYFAQERNNDTILSLKRFFNTIELLKNSPDAHYLSIHSMSNIHQAHFMLGTTYERQGNYPEALTELKKSIELEPRYVEAYYNLAVVYEKTGNPREAIDLYRKTTELNHSFLPGLKRLGMLLLETDRAEEGIAILKRAQNLEEHR